jgi:hypothetical protein
MILIDELNQSKKHQQSHVLAVAVSEMRFDFSEFVIDGIIPYHYYQSIKKGL